jgi:sulfate adenylyltransferase
MVYVGMEHGNARGYMSDTEAKEKGLDISKLSGTKFRDLLRSGGEVPEWFAFPSVVDILQKGGDEIFVK